MKATAVLRLVGTLAAGVVALCVLAVPARAGGPTSVLMVNSASGQTGALYFRDADYDALAAAVGWYGGDNQPMATVSPADGSLTSEIRLTWLVHDMSIWRVDRIHANAEGGWLVETTVDLTGASLDGATPVWHRPADTVHLEALLRTHGIVGAAAAKPVTPAGAAAAAVPGAAHPPTGWWPPLAAGLAGVVLGLLGTLVLNHSRRTAGAGAGPPRPPSAGLPGARPDSGRVRLTG